MTKPRTTSNAGVAHSSRSTSRDEWGTSTARTALFTLATILVGLLTARSMKAQDAYLFAYFKEPGNQGIYLALSKDGLHYTALNDGQPWLVPTDARANP